jgi:amino acid transporter
MTSIGTLFAFVIVSVAVPVLRAKRPEAKRPFKVPFGSVIPVLGAVSCLYLMVSLSVMTWVRFLVWLDLGMLIYWFYGRTHSSLANRAEAAMRTGAQEFANLVTILGALVTFNGFAIALLGFLTTWGVTNEAQARWSELDYVLSKVGLHISAEIADKSGLLVLGIGIAILVVGMVLRKSTASPAAAGRI